jgi:hypothetical protein
VPFCHLQVARHVKAVAPGAPFNASRASSNAWTLTPLFANAIAMVFSPERNAIFRRGYRNARPGAKGPDHITPRLTPVNRGYDGRHGDAGG